MGDLEDLKKEYKKAVKEWTYTAHDERYKKVWAMSGASYHSAYRIETLKVTMNGEKYWAFHSFKPISAIG